MSTFICRECDRPLRQHTLQDQLNDTCSGSAPKASAHQQVIVELQAELAKVTTERDQALAEVAKWKDSSSKLADTVSALAVAEDGLGSIVPLARDLERLFADQVENCPCDVNEPCQYCKDTIEVRDAHRSGLAGTVKDWTDAEDADDWVLAARKRARQALGLSD